MSKAITVNFMEMRACRVCGRIQDEPPWGLDGDCPNYCICDCCGVEFGYEDLDRSTVTSYRQSWLKNGANWFQEKAKPAGWNLKLQMKNIPERFKE